MVLGIGAVEQDGHVVVLLIGVVLLELRQHVALHETGTDDEEGDIGLVADDGGIGDNLHRRTIDEDVVVVLAQLVEHGLQTGRVEQLRGVGRNLTHGEDIEDLGRRCGLAFLLVVKRMVDDKVLIVIGTATQVVGETVTGLVHELGEGATAQVEVDTDDTAVADGKRGTEVGRDEGLTTAGVEGGEHDNLALLLLVGHELEVSTDNAVGLVGDVATMLTHHEVVTAVGLIALGGFPQGELAHIGDGEVLEVLTATHLGVARLADDEEGCRDGQRDGEGDEEDAVALGRGGVVAAPRLGDDTGVIGGEGL